MGYMTGMLLPTVTYMGALRECSNMECPRIRGGHFRYKPWRSSE